MRDRYYSKKDQKGQYDPQVGAAAAANTAVAQKSEQWNEDFYNKYVAPALQQSIEESKVNLDRQGGIYDLNMAQAKLQDERYRTLGIPAEDKYYQMVKDYSGPEEEERQAQAALGDQRTAQQVQQQQLQRRFSGLGIDPTSPAALSAQSDVAVQNAAANAAASTRARAAAKTLGMSLTSDAANFGRGGQSGILQFGGAAGGAASAGLAGANQTAAIAPGGAANVNAGLGLAQKAYGSNLDAYTSLNNTALAHAGDASAGAGKLLGTIGGALLAPMTGGASMTVGQSLFNSDRRIKKHAKKIATLAHDIGMWTFRYIWEPDTAPLRRGYMADEVEPIFPDAVVVGAGGYKMVDYGKVLV
jgi:hypothetical protein